MMTLTVPCLFGLESLVADEMRRLGLQEVRAENGRVAAGAGGGHPPSEPEPALRPAGAFGVGLLPRRGF